MINIRQNVFETNSSSVHSFVIPKDCRVIKIPSSIKLSGSEDTRDQMGRIRYMYQLAYENGYGPVFINYLKSKGIIIEDDIDNNEIDNMCQTLDITLDDLDQICFNLECIDEYDRENYKKVENDHINYTHIEITNR